MSLGSCNLPKSLFKCTLLALSAGLVQSAIVRTSFGQLEGAQLQLDDGRLVHLFKKVPFAEPPVKELRFELPRPPSKWRKVRNAKEYGPACMSNSTQTSSPQKWVDEDCLHLNIFTSQACLETKDCPVLFYIHGGTVEYDSAVMFNDSILVQNFVSKDVVMVLAAFRLGIFSHLFFESQDVVPQNLAMYDVLQGLKFVNEEIENFGGDNSKVTLLGHSYGGAVAAALVYSPVEFEKQLFHQVAAMSTTMLFNKFDEQVAATWRFIEAAGCLPPNRRPAFPAHFRENYATECLRKLDQFTILGIQRKMEEADHYIPYNIFVQSAPLFPEGTMQDLVKHPKKINMMVGTTKTELDFDQSSDNMNLAEFVDVRNPTEVMYKYRYQRDHGTLPFEHHGHTQGVYLSTHMLARSVAKSGANVYLYSYRYPKHSDHTSDLSYIMGVHKFEQDENEQIIAKLYPQYFVNFIKYGRPSKDWIPFNPAIDNYFDINVNLTSGLGPHMEIHYEHDVIDYWNKDIKKFDDEVTMLKMKKNPLLKDVPINMSVPMASPFETSTRAPTFLLLLLIFLAGLLIGAFLCHSRRTIILVPYEIATEKTPLYSNLR